MEEGERWPQIKKTIVQLAIQKLLESIGAMLPTMASTPVVT
jgi:hypothetical protein